MKVLLLLLALSSSAFGQILAPIMAGAPAAASGVTFVQGVGNCNYNTTAANTISISPTAGNTLILAFAEYSDVLHSPVSVQASDGTNLTQDVAVAAVGPSSDKLYVYRYTNVAGGVTSVTYTWTGANYTCGSVIEVHGLAASPLDAVDLTGHGGNASTWTTGTVSPTGSLNEIIIGFAFDEASATAPTSTAPYTAAGRFGLTSISGGMAYQIVASTSGTYTPNGGLTGTDNYASVYASYKGP